MKRPEEPNPALGWRAIRVGLDKKGVMRMQLQALIRAAVNRPPDGDVSVRGANSTNIARRISF